MNRAVHLAGGRLAATIDKLGPTYSVEMWLWNGLPNDARDLTGHLFTRAGDKLSIGGRAAPGRLLFSQLAGRSEIAVKTWYHVILVRDGRKVGVYLNGEREISGEVDPTSGDELFVGGQADSSNSLEGKIDEVVVYRRALKQDEIARRFKSVGFKRPGSIQTAEEPPMAFGHPGEMKTRTFGIGAIISARLKQVNRSAFWRARPRDQPGSAGVERALE